MQAVLLCALVLLLVVSMVGAFFRPTITSQRGIRLHALPSDVIERLEDIRNRYLRLSNVVSPEAEAEAANLKEVANAYSTYKEISTMLAKMRLIYKNEASETRKDKQLQGFMEIYMDKVELEEVLKEKLGLPFRVFDDDYVPNEVARVKEALEKVEMLEEKLRKVEVKLEPGKPTGEARYGKRGLTLTL